MQNTLQLLLDRLDDASKAPTNVIPWSCPVPSFGDLSRSEVATLGLNPSNREFVDESGDELEGSYRRFHTLQSLGLVKWSDAKTEHMDLIIDSCQKYFSRNPYNGWFKRLDNLIAGTDTSYYDNNKAACHLDLIPFATSCKWTELTIEQRNSLLKFAGDSLGLLLHESHINLLILNGRTVVESLQEISGSSFEIQEIDDWTLRRRSGPDVKGYAFRGSITELAGVAIGRTVYVLGFNHNIQSSFGVTRQVMSSIQQWIATTAKEMMNEDEAQRSL